MRRALEHHGKLAGFVPIDARDEYENYPGHDAPASLNVGDPDAVIQAHRLGSHRMRWLLLAPNGQRIPSPERWVMPSRELPNGLVDGFCAPSAWAVEVLREHYPNRPVVLAPHGVTPGIHRPPSDAEIIDARKAQYRAGIFHVLHMTSTETPRKGTDKLLEAWKLLAERGVVPERALLTIIADPLHMSEILWEVEESGLGKRVVVYGGLSLPPRLVVEQMYWRSHCVCQPSRAEGFGLVPLESLACGTPVVATTCTGHSEFLGEDGSKLVGVQVVESGPVEPMSDFEGSRAPTVDVGAIAEALSAMIAGWEGQYARALNQAQNGWRDATPLAAQWSWEKKNEAAIDEILRRK